MESTSYDDISPAAAVVGSTATTTTNANNSSSGGSSNNNNNNSSSNINVELCLVCGDRASGRHYGAISCEGCKGFFKRSIRKQLGYQCRGTMNCEVTKHHRNRCQFCRLQKCLASGMRSDSVQHERKPIVDKKEVGGLVTGGTGQGSSSSAASGIGNSATSSSGLYHHHGGGGGGGGSHHHHHRGKLYNHASSVGGGATSGLSAGTGGTASTVSAAGVAVAAAAAAVGASPESLGNTVFPVGFNFADLTQTLIMAANPYQQQSQQHGSQQTVQQQQPDNASGYVYSPGLDEDSIDNSTSMALLRDHTNLPSASTAAGLIQSSIDKNVISESLDMIASIQQQYDQRTDHSTNTTTAVTSNQSQQSFNSIVKEEIIIDDQSTGGGGKSLSDDDRPGSDRHDRERSFEDDEYSNDRGGSGDNRRRNNADPADTDIGIFDGPLLPDVNIPFNLQIPAIVPSYLNVHYVCESGSRLLFLSVYWIKKIAAFQQLPDELKIQLLRRHWVEMFAVGLAQCSRSLSIPTIMSTLVSNILQLSEIEKSTVAASVAVVMTGSQSQQGNCSQAQKIRKLSEHAFQLNEFVQTVQQMEVDDHEFAYIRLIIIFSPDNLNIKDPSKRALLEKLQYYTLRCLKGYLNEINYSDANERISKILLRLMPLRSLESVQIEELFFSNLIGHVQIDYMIPYILKLGGGGI